MAATTRARTGNSKPRLLTTIQNTLTPTKNTTKANTSKPRSSNKVVSGRVGKASPSTTTTKKTTTAKKTPAAKAANVKMVKKPRTKTEKVVDAVTGTAEKVVGDLEGKSGKKAAGTRKVRGTDRMAARRV
ncbi:hypothetical protein PtrSN002B_008364 [Pyrenophora tritici-repentis]|uniref:HC2 multi-domain protein n=2 Tax=Pyrenophora tritici-repentis TaxID=45151 RepID=A0A2W1EBZ1_9PLEO|nr:uncharacterized protein PTRG_11479 [Pyrenophora tritici-repentis Pt-1C-BFP]KAA8624502.1 hypothetical protein PtrV1_00182 [Pyrenophora tritici-repentis]EDU44529.1 predicted protein [Pyrenophora tritici-repentis Pt-1C-BFP]KAF7452904.1 hypothetical protein A1F99_001620 [Pyrenophora tritici-repentis]KAF7575943.1 HC2 multi-domain protein [Pyrenophora tritici-repentis]KAG9377635.1 hypothetical protein A1F94_012038 [Pyrenophora tritici-repentis]